MKAIGADTGGTFTDLVLLEGDEVQTVKVHSTPKDPSEAVLSGLEALGGAPGVELIHGSTVGLNAMLTGGVAPTALVTNEGFRDLIEIGRQDRPELYALHPTKPSPLVERRRRFEIAQRAFPSEGGSLEVTQRPTKAELSRLAERVRRSGAKSVAVCLLHSYADPAMEEEVARHLEAAGLSVTCSARLFAEYREFERFSTAIANASLVPIVRAYIERLSERVGERELSILQSSGGSFPASQAAHEPVRVLFSGPAGGVVGAARAAAQAGHEEVVTLDMGGTSTDVAFHSNKAGLEEAVNDVQVAGHPIGVPALDIHTIGCGGGSIVSVDPSGVLRVGPLSAGASPGPVCYGTGTDLTVTDAHVMLGHLSPGAFLGGALELDVEEVKRGFTALGKKLGVSQRAAAEGVLSVARAAMRRAVGVMTMQRGRDPQRLPLVAFGGAGGLHAAALADSLNQPGALIPRHPGALSAWGMAHADAVQDRSQTVLGDLGDWPRAKRASVLKELAQDTSDLLRASGHAQSSIQTEFRLDLRYRGQSYDLALSEGRRDDAATRFHRAHAERFGWALEDAEVELVHLRARALVRRTLPRTGEVQPKRLSKSAVLGTQRAGFNGQVLARRIQREALQEGVRFHGPAIIEEYSGTTLLPPKWSAQVTKGLHLWLSKI
ncbi:MAG: 5-oxoprolinase [Deltaproteobacteria bacterium]|nr:5-oxoprolinase [Deltaproteobacteria bacterium]